MKEARTGTYIYNGEYRNFNFYTEMSAYDKLIFVNSVVDTLVDDDNYNSIVRDLIFDFTIVRMFTDIDTSFVNQKDDDENDINPIIPIEDFLLETNVVEIVKANVPSYIFDELNNAINLNIQYRTGIHYNPVSEAIANLISALEKKMAQVDLDSIMDVAQKFAGMTDDFTLDNLVNTYMNSDIHKNNLVEIQK